MFSVILKINLIFLTFSYFKEIHLKNLQPKIAATLENLMKQQSTLFMKLTMKYFMLKIQCYPYMAI